MKKTLIALAVLAASGASFAQVTITGNLAMGYKLSTTAAVDASGFGVDTSQIDFAATEDLGGGWKMAAKMALAGADRSGESGTGAVAGRDASLTLTTGAGAFILSANRSADYLTGGVSGVAGVGFGGKIFSARRTADAVAYVVPVGPVTVSLVHQENDQATGASGTMALGTGAAGSSFQRLNVVGVTYAAGPLTANGQYLSYDNRSNPSANTTADYVTRASGSYDFSVAKLGLGYSQANYSAGGIRKDALIGVSVPAGALTVGAQWGQRKTEGFSTAADGSNNGTALAVTYALSKRTSVIGNYARWDMTGQSTANTETNILLSHSF
ncbi:MAG: porin [Rhodoferax sp.]|nr:porin [Rhodoferax sp.]MDP3653068.1 porin [Rhodoferax sp.]